MSYRRRQATLANAIASARPRNLNPKGWGENIEVGAQVTSFGRHGAGQPAIDGKVVRVVDHGEAVVSTRDGERKRSISNLRRVG